MRAYLPAYELKEAPSLASALKWLAREPGAWQPFAGGTDLMVLFEAGQLPPGKFLSLWNLRELKGIKADKQAVTLGALTTYSEVRAHPLLGKEFPLLGCAAAETGAIAIQNRGTLGGNIGNASPAADTPPALLVYEAELELVSTRGARWIPYSDFHTAYKKTLRRPDELISRIRLPRATDGAKVYYRKVGTRRAQAISKVCLAGLARLTKPDGRIEAIRIAMGSVAPTPLRCLKTEAFLRDKVLDASLICGAQAVLSTEIAPIDDIRSDVAYRRQVSLNLLREFLEEVRK